MATAPFQVHATRAGERAPNVPDEPPAENPAPKPRADGLSWWECIFGFAVFVAWLLLFGGGIMIDTEPYRRLISPSGANALSAAPAAAAAAAASPLSASDTPGGLFGAWLVVLTCFVPLNLAWICAASSGLGAFGNLANLGEDGTDSPSSDRTNPYASALLRGFFVYLFMMSGLLAFEDEPFTNAGPTQYIRLAGFLSLFSFVVSYQPRFFASLIVAAFQRLQARGADSPAQSQIRAEADTVSAKVDVDRGTVDVAVAKHSAQRVVERKED